MNKILPIFFIGLLAVLIVASACSKNSPSTSDTNNGVGSSNVDASTHLSDNTSMDSSGIDAGQDPGIQDVGTLDDVNVSDDVPQ